MTTPQSANPEQTPAGEMSLDEALRYAVELQRTHRLDAAETLFLRILDAVPGHPDALHYLGLLKFQRGRPDEAIDLLEQAIAGAPDFADFHGNLGNVLTALGRLEAAEASHRRAIALDGTRADFHSNLGVLFRVAGQGGLAEAEYWRAIELDPKHFRAYNNLGMLYAARDDIKSAVQYYCKSITLMPQHPDGYKLLGLAYYSTGQLEEAAEVFRQWLERHPEDPIARHMHAACSGRDVPERAGDDFIVETFDRFAESFEEQLQQRLNYRAPQLIVDAVQRYLPPPAKQFDILDAGCGTGLCGPLIAPWATQLVGVDLSVGMLHKAEGKGCYHRLYRVELTEFLNTPQESAGYDVILSADTLCYFGPLDAVSVAARQALRARGLFVFSVENAGDKAPEGHLLNPHGRYAHTEPYARSCLSQSGFNVLAVDQVVLRTEGGMPVNGLVVVAQAV